MSDAVTARLRRLVFDRVSGLCEYCLIHRSDAHFSFQVDHIISRKQGGPTKAANLALACLRCNVAKGTDPAAYIGRPGGSCDCFIRARIVGANTSFSRVLASFR